MQPQIAPDEQPPLPRRRESDLDGLAAFTLDEAGRLVSWPATATSLFGHQAHTVIGQHVCDVLMSGPGHRTLVDRTLAQVAAGAVLTTTVAGGLLGDGRFAFARSSELESGGAVSAPIALEDSMAHAPPSLEIPQPQLATREGHTLVRGTAGDDLRLLDAYIFVGSRKVFYRSNRNGSDPRHMGFDADVPLRPGVNVVTIVARENPDTTTRRTFIVRRDGANGELLPTPKTDDELSETAANDEP